MAWILPYQIFLEKERVRLNSVAKISGVSDLAKKLKDDRDAPFDSDRDFVKLITLNKRIAGKKAQFSVKWNHSARHSLLHRIEQRSSFQSVSEFNEYFKKVFNQIFPDMLGKEIISNGKYAIYISEYNFTFILGINIDRIMKGIYEVFVVTIAPGRSEQEVVKVIEIF